MKKYNKVRCPKCKTMQEINDKIIYQDITGKWVICKECGSAFGVEPKEVK